VLMLSQIGRPPLEQVCRSKLSTGSPLLISVRRRQFEEHYGAPTESRPLNTWQHRRPRSSPVVYPVILSAAGFHSVIRPSLGIAKTSSAAAARPRHQGVPSDGPPADRGPSAVLPREPDSSRFDRHSARDAVPCWPPSFGLALAWPFIRFARSVPGTRSQLSRNFIPLCPGLLEVS